MGEGPEYPKAAYRLGGDIEIWGRMMDMRSLVDEQDEANALRTGWALHPNDVPNDEPLTAEPVTVKRGPGRPRKLEG